MVVLKIKQDKESREKKYSMSETIWKKYTMQCYAIGTKER